MQPGLATVASWPVFLSPLHLLSLFMTLKPQWCCENINQAMSDLPQNQNQAQPSPFLDLSRPTWTCRTSALWPAVPATHSLLRIAAVDGQLVFFFISLMLFLNELSIRSSSDFSVWYWWVDLKFFYLQLLTIPWLSVSAHSFTILPFIPSLTPSSPAWSTLSPHFHEVKIDFAFLPFLNLALWITSIFIINSFFVVCLSLFASCLYSMLVNSPASLRPTGVEQALMDVLW